MIDGANDGEYFGSFDYIQTELKRTERQLEIQSGSPSPQANANDDTIFESSTTTPSVTNRLYQLTNEINDLNLIYELSTTTDYIVQTQQAATEPSHHHTTTTTTATVVSWLLQDLQRLETLSKFLSSHRNQQQQQQSGSPTTNRMIRIIYEQEYIPLYEYLRDNFILLLRKQLHELNYPTIITSTSSGISGTNHDDDNADNATAMTPNMKSAIERIIQICQSYHHLTHNIHSKMVSIFHSASSSRENRNDTTTSSMDPIVTEFCRPIVERIRYHFVTGQATTTTATSTDRSNSNYNTKIERLPELLFGYIREYVFDSDHSPWDMVCHIHDVLSTNITTTTQTLAYDFLNEMIRTVQYVFSERNFFRHPSILSGPTTSTTVYKPIYLSKAIEQILQFDSYIQTDVLYSLFHKNDDNDDEIDDGDSKNNSRQIIRLMDVCVVGDDELLQWWLDRERESILSTLFDDHGTDNRTTDTTVAKMTGHGDNNASHCLYRISARAELFCSLFRSIQIKASIFTFTGPYYSTVAVPMCIEFLDAIHETITDMKHKLLTTGSKTKSKLPTDGQLSEMIDQWIEVINGTYMAATMLTNSDSVDSINNETSVVNDDMIRFGRSLQRLQVVIIDDLITTIIETIIMERCKFAAYLMRCSFLLSQQNPSTTTTGTLDHDDICMSYDLSETYRILSIILNRCWIMNDGVADSAVTQSYLDVNNFAPSMIRERILSSMAEKILEVALDIHGMTPDLNQYGCSIFAHDAVVLLSSHDDKYDSISTALPEYVLRVLDIVKIMQYDSATLRGIGNALCGLSGQSAPLREDEFGLDDRIYDEAICMIRAKGLLYIELSDVINVLNRRRDL